VLLIVTRGKLTPQVPHNEWNWDALPHGDDSFLVPFPSKEELTRMHKDELKPKNLGVVLTFTQWKEGEDISSSIKWI
jgi:hypothetical protein